MTFSEQKLVVIEILCLEQGDQNFLFNNLSPKQQSKFEELKVELSNLGFTEEAFKSMKNEIRQLLKQKSATTDKTQRDILLQQIAQYSENKGIPVPEKLYQYLATGRG